MSFCFRFHSTALFFSSTVFRHLLCSRYYHRHLGYEHIHLFFILVVLIFTRICSTIVFSKANPPAESIAFLADALATSPDACQEGWDWPSSKLPWCSYTFIFQKRRRIAWLIVTKLLKQFYFCIEPDLYKANNYSPWLYPGDDVAEYFCTYLLKLDSLLL